MSEESVDNQEALLLAIKQLGELSVAYVEAKGKGMNFCLEAQKTVDFLKNLVTELKP